MGRKRGMGFFFMVFVVVVIIVIASILSFVVQEEDILLAPDFDASLTIQNTAPMIINIYAVEDEFVPPTTGDRAQAIGGTTTPDSTNTVKIFFLAKDVNGVDDLPGATGVTIRQSTAPGQLGTSVCGGFCNIEVYVTSPGLHYAATNKFANAGSCQRETTCPHTGGCPQDSMEFRCTVPMEYFDEPGIGWDITVGIADAAGINGDEDTLTQTNTFEYLGVVDFDFLVTNSDLSWTGIELDSTNQIGVPGSSIDVQNFGNLDLISGDVQGRNLPHSGAGSAVPGTAFSVSSATGGAPPQECNFPTTATQLTASPPDVAIFEPAANQINVPYGRGNPPVLPAEQDSIYFCLHQQLDLLGLTFPVSGTYSTTNVGGTPWQLTLSNV